MNRLQKKCFIGATGLHALLVVILFVGPGFLADNPIDESDVITFVPAILTDEKFSNPGATAPRQPQAPPEQQRPPQQLAEPQRPQTPPEAQRQPARQPDPPKPEPLKVNKPDPESLESTTDKKPTRQVQVSDKVVKLRDPKAKTTKPSTDTASNQRSREVTSALRRIEGNLSPTTRVEMPEGPGGGSGVSYANYAQEVRRVYTEACRIPPEVEDDQAVVKVRVTIARNGNVIDSSIIQRSGSVVIDRAIQATLDRVTFVAPFPAGAKEAQRTFVISFDLKAKKLLG